MKTISRRHMLAMSAAAGTFAMGGGYRTAEAQAAKRIERLDPALDAIIDPSEPIVTQGCCIASFRSLSSMMNQTQLTLPPFAISISKTKSYGSLPISFAASSIRQPSKRL